jgi:outer membrane protein TolC
MTSKMDIAFCAQALADAREKHDDVKVDLDSAERRMTVARNELNEAQKAFDAAVAQVKADAPWNTKWHSEKHPMKSVA